MYRENPKAPFSLILLVHNRSPRTRCMKYMNGFGCRELCIGGRGRRDMIIRRFSLAVRIWWALEMISMQRDFPMIVSDIDHIVRVATRTPPSSNSVNRVASTIISMHETLLLLPILLVLLIMGICYMKERDLYDLHWVQLLQWYLRLARKSIILKSTQYPIFSIHFFFLLEDLSSFLRSTRGCCHAVLCCNFKVDLYKVYMQPWDTTLYEKRASSTAIASLSPSVQDAFHVALLIIRFHIEEYLNLIWFRSDRFSQSSGRLFFSFFSRIFSQLHNFLIAYCSAAVVLHNFQWYMIILRTYSWILGAGQI